MMQSFMTSIMLFGDLLIWTPVGNYMFVPRVNIDKWSNLDATQLNSLLAYQTSAHSSGITLYIALLALGVCGFIVGIAAGIVALIKFIKEKRVARASNAIVYNGG